MKALATTILLGSFLVLSGFCSLGRGQDRPPRQARPERSGLLALLESGARLMYVSAHPDDEIAIGPLLARAADLTKVIVVSLTDGGGGGNRGGVKLSGSLGEARAKEFAASCKVLGVECRVLGFENEPPREVRQQMMRERKRETAEEAIERWRRSGRDPLAELVQAIREWKPDIIFSFDAEQGFTLHHEHQAVGLLVRAALPAAAEPDKYPEQLRGGLQPWRARRWYTAVNLFGFVRNPRIPKIDEARLAERIDGKEQSLKRGKTYLEIAQEAMTQHVTQFGGDFLTPERKAMFAQEIGVQNLILESPQRPPQFMRSQPGERARAKQVTRETLRADAAAARAELAKLAAIPTGIPAATLEALRAKRLGYNLQPDNAALWEATARADDFAKVGPQGYQAAELISRGYIALQYPPAAGRLPAPSAELEKKARATTLSEQADPDSLAEAARKVHSKGKDLISAPTGQRLEDWGPERVGEVAHSSDVFVIQSERWLVEDQTADKHEYLDHVLKWTAVIRKANPKCQIFIEVGRRLDRGGGTAAQWLDAYARLYGRDPHSFDGMYPFITRQPTDDPKQGIGALKQLLAWLRPPQQP